MKFDIMRLDSVDSTNSEAKRLALAGAMDGTVVIAKEQTGGRGRLGRKWHSPEGGLWFSIVLKDGITPENIHKFTMAAGIAVAKSLRSIGIDANIKWPNDVLASGGKICGMLSETAVENGKIAFAILGIGINSNVGSFPEGAPGAVSASMILKKRIDNEALLGNILARFSELIELPAEEIAKIWTGLSGTIGKRIVITTGNGEIEGIAERIDPDGALVVDGKRILAGDCRHARNTEGAAIRLRGHHLLCIFGFRGKGYDENFVENMGRIVSELASNPNAIIKIIEGCDYLCAKCPNMKNVEAAGGNEVRCFLKDAGSDAEIKQQDSRVLDALGLRIGSSICASELQRLAAKRIPAEGLPKICGNCPWISLGFCAEGIRRGRIGGH